METKQKKVKTIRPNAKIFRADEPVNSVLVWGISYSINQSRLVCPRPVLLNDDFKAYMKISVSNHLFSRNILPSHYRFREMSPLVFRDLRQRFCVTDDMLLDSFFFNEALIRCRLSKKKRSSVMMTYDKRFVVLLISSEESQLIQSNLKRYHEHIVKHNGRTRLAQWLAHYRLSLRDMEVYNAFVISNVFYAEHGNSYKFAVQGDVKSARRNNHISSELEFLNLKHVINIGSQKKRMLLHEVKRDLLFVQNCRFGTAQLLVGISSPNALCFGFLGSSNPLAQPMIGTNAADALVASSDCVLFQIDSLEEKAVVEQENLLEEDAVCLGVKDNPHFDIIDHGIVRVPNEELHPTTNMGSYYAIADSSNADLTYSFGLAVSLRAKTRNHRASCSKLVHTEHQSSVDVSCASSQKTKQLSYASSKANNPLSSVSLINTKHSKSKKTTKVSRECNERKQTQQKESNLVCTSFSDENIGSIDPGKHSCNYQWNQYQLLFSRIVDFLDRHVQ